MTDLERYRDYEIDHEPDGWPAIQMKDVTALVDEIEQQRARVKELEAEKARLVEALEEALHHVIISPDPVRGDFIQEIEAALDAYRKQDPTHDNQ